MNWPLFILIGIGVCLITRSRGESILGNLMVCVVGAVSCGAIAEASGIPAFGQRIPLIVALFGSFFFWAIKEIARSCSGGL